MVSDRLRESEPLEGVGRPRDEEARALEPEREHLEEVGLVVNHEDSEMFHERAAPRRGAAK